MKVNGAKICNMVSELKNIKMDRNMLGISSMDLSLEMENTISRMEISMKENFIAILSMGMGQWF